MAISSFQEHSLPFFFTPWSQIRWAECFSRSVMSSNIRWRTFFLLKWKKGSRKNSFQSKTSFLCVCHMAQQREKRKIKFRHHEVIVTPFQDVEERYWLMFTVWRWLLWLPQYCTFGGRNIDGVTERKYSSASIVLHFIDWKTKISMANVCTFKRKKEISLFISNFWQVQLSKGRHS